MLESRTSGLLSPDKTLSVVTWLAHIAFALPLLLFPGMLFFIGAIFAGAHTIWSRIAAGHYVLSFLGYPVIYLASLIYTFTAKEQKRSGAVILRNAFLPLLAMVWIFLADLLYEWTIPHMIID